MTGAMGPCVINRSTRLIRKIPHQAEDARWRAGIRSERPGLGSADVILGIEEILNIELRGQQGRICTDTRADVVQL